MDIVQSLKLSLFTHGLNISPDASRRLTGNGQMPLTVHEYATTGGITLAADGGIYINAPFDGPFSIAPETTLLFDSKSGGYLVAFHGHELPVQVLPLPGYLYTKDSKGRPVTATAFSHADRVRLSPIYGCTMSCKFCDIAGHNYVRRPLEQLTEALNVAKGDSSLPVHHVLISGGTPARGDYPYFDEICAGIVDAANMPVDVATPPRSSDPGFIDRLTYLGIYGFSINLEVYDDEVARNIVPQKHAIGLHLYKEAIERAVEQTGGQGRVRSLIIVGLEPLDKTLDAVRFLAQLGCDPVLSPFRPSEGTPLANYPIPSYDFLERAYLESVEIVEKFGVKLGPRCVPCQHNTLTFPDGSSAYYFSEKLNRKDI